MAISLCIMPSPSECIFVHLNADKGDANLLKWHRIARLWQGYGVEADWQD